MMERRFTELRLNADAGRIAGTASPTYDGTPGTQYELAPGMVERFAAGAFDAHLATGKEVVATFNHNPSNLLGRTPDTLRLRSDSKGLHYEVDLPDTTVGRDLQTLIATGRVSGSSFAFRATKVEWQRDNGNDIRLIRQAEVYELGPVSMPAYSGSSVGLRGHVQAEERQRLEQERDDFHARLETEKRLARLHSISSQVSVTPASQARQISSIKDQR